MALLTLLAVAATVLEAAQPAPVRLIAFIQESGLALYLLAGLMFGAFMAIVFPANLSRFLAQYRTRIARAAGGFLAMFGFGFATLMSLAAVLALVGQVAWGKGVTGGQTNALLLTMVSAIVLGCAVSVAEEALFRGFLVSYLRWNTSDAVTIGAVATSALVFALAHNLQDPFGWFTASDFPLFVGLFLLGTLLAVAYVVTRSLWCPIGLHAGLVAFDIAILKGEVITLDLSPWWLGGTDDVREAPLVWLTWVIATTVLVLSRRKLWHHFAIEQPFVGAWLSDQKSSPLGEKSGRATALG